MTQGRKSRTARALACLLATLFAIAAISPAFAGAQTGAEDEYELSPNIPNPDDDGRDGSGGDQSEAGTDAGTATDTDPAASDDSGTAPAAGSGGGDGKGGNGGAGSGQSGEPSKASSVGDPVPAIETSSSDDGGAPVLLILLAAIAAVCTGVALWRMRRDPPTAGRSPGADRTSGAPSESQSI